MSLALVWRQVLAGCWTTYICTRMLAIPECPLVACILPTKAEHKTKFGIAEIASEKEEPAWF